MRTHHRRIVVAVLAALSLPLCGTTVALAVSADPNPVANHSRPIPEPKVGDTPSDSTQPVAPETIGDTPVDHPGASRAPAYDPPTTIEVVRPERNVVGDADPALPTVMAGLALLAALGGAGFALARTRSRRRSMAGG